MTRIKAELPLRPSDHTLQLSRALSQDASDDGKALQPSTAIPAAPPLPPPPPPPLPPQWCQTAWPSGDGDESLFVGCLQCTQMILVRYHDSPFTVAQVSTWKTRSSLVVTTCRACLKASQDSDIDTTIEDVANRCERASATLRVATSFIRTSTMYEAACIIARTAVAVHEPEDGVAAYESVQTLVDEMTAQCIVTGIHLPPGEPARDARILPYLPGGFL